MKVLVSDNLSSLGIEKLKQEEGIDVDVKTGLSESEIIKIIPEYEGLIVRSATKVTPKIIEVAKRLKVIGRAGVGVDNINLDAAGKHGVIVMNAPDGNLITTAEHTIALMLSMARNIPEASSTLQTGIWSPKKFMGVELYKKTLGIVGLGRIGSAVAKRARGLEMNVIGLDPYISKEYAEKLGIETVELNDLLKRSDFITLHTPKVPGGPLFSKKQFDIMKPGIRIINCARGALIDTQALIQAIKEGKVAQAALDVYEKEPLDPESSLLKTKEIICTPHLGASTGEAQDKVAIAISEQIISYLKYGQVQNAINMPSIDAELLSQIKPYLNLAENLGKLISQITEGAIKSIHFYYNGEVSRLKIDPITVTILQGLFALTIDGVNMVNAPFIAKERNIEIQETKSNEIKDYTSTIGVKVTTDKGSRDIVGSLSGKGTPRIVKIDAFDFEAGFSKHMLIFTNYDAPGVIGRVGSILEENGINIAGFHLGRMAEKGGKAVAVVNIDTGTAEKALEALRNAENILNIYSVTL